MKKPVKSGGATLISSAFCKIRHIRDAGSKTCRLSYLEKNSRLICSTGISFPVQRRNASAPW